MHFSFVATSLFLCSTVAVPTAIITNRPTKVVLTLQAATDFYLFNVTISQFMAARNVEDGAALGLNWTTNGCSVALDDPFGFDFFKACTRHDFGYRNYKQQRRCGRLDKKRLDLNFREDLYTQCAREQHERVRDACETVAAVYYGSVRLFGGPHFCSFDW